MEAAIELRGPAEVEQLLETQAIALDQLGKDLDRATDDLSDTEERWTSHLDEVISQLEEDNDRLPGEEVRISIARRREDGEALWFALRRAERDVKRIERRITQTSTVISALQTKMRQIRAEGGGNW